MISNKQLKANHQNGKLGGVKTQSGKDIVKFNALTHGILRQTLTAYEKDFYLGIYADLVREYNPITVFEKILVERITVYYLKLFRVQRAEQEYINAAINPHIEEQKTGLPSLNDLGIYNVVIKEGYIPQMTERNVQQLADIYSRYEITIENRLYKAFHELERTIAIRKGQSISPTFNIFQMGSFGRNPQNS